MILRPILRPVLRSPLRSVFDGGVGGGGSPKPIDLFVIVGQSNAEGRGNSAQSPDATATGIYFDGSDFSALADPVGGAVTGSMWPAFANEWFAQTGRRSVYVECALGGSALLPDQAGSNWSPSGSLRGAAVTAAGDAIDAIEASPSYELTGVYFLWAQGEQDAANGAAEADYEAALEALAAYFKAQVTQMSTMGVVQTGWNKNLPAQIAAYAAIRAAQDSACDDSANLSMLYRGTHSFWASNPVKMADGVHYNQPGLNLAGRCAARELAVGPSPLPPAPSIIASAAYPDPSYASKASRTAAHTTVSGTHALLVAVATMRNDASAILTISGVTFNGVAMKEVSSAVSSGGSGNGYIRVALYQIDEATFGGSLSEVTADVAVTMPGASSARMIDWCAFDCDRPSIADFVGEFAPSPANVASGATASTANAPALWITIGGSTAAGATPLTATLTGATEIMDHGLANAGGTRVCQVVVGHSTEGISVNRSVTANWGANCEAMAIATFVMRGKVAGE